MIENPLALELLEGTFTDGDTIRAFVDGEAVRFERAGVAVVSG